MKRILAVDLSDPIILSVEGYVLDGQHRLARCLLEGVAEIPARQFEANPPPFKVESYEEFKRNRPLIAASLAKMEAGKL